MLKLHTLEVVLSKLITLQFLASLRIYRRIDTAISSTIEEFWLTGKVKMFQTMIKQHCNLPCRWNTWV